LHSSPSTPLTVLREHTAVLLGGYNNQWTMRLLHRRRYQFTPEPVNRSSIGREPQVHWTRPFSAVFERHDYALLARFVTLRPIVGCGLAGLGRNGTEAARNSHQPHTCNCFETDGKRLFKPEYRGDFEVDVSRKDGRASILTVYSW